MTPKAVNIKLRIDEATHADLQARAREAERSVAAEIRLAIRRHLAAKWLDERTSA